MSSPSGRDDKIAASVEDVVSNCPFCGWSDLEDWQAKMLHEAHANLEALASAEPGSSEFEEALAEARRFVGVV